MADNNRPTRGAEWRNKIQTSMLLNRLQDNALGKIELTHSQLRSIEILLRKTMPDLKDIEYSSEDGKGLVVQIVSWKDVDGNTG